MLALICNRCNDLTPTLTDGYCLTCYPLHQAHRNQQPTRHAHHTAAHRHVTRIVKQRDRKPYGWSCAHCGSRLTEQDMTIDYLIPLVAHGRQHSDNAVIACRPCNSSRGGSLSNGGRGYAA